MREGYSADALKELRGAQGLSQQDLAHKAGVSYRTISTIENGGRARATTLRKIADALGIPLADLLNPGELEAAS